MANDAASWLETLLPVMFASEEHAREFQEGPSCPDQRTVSRGSRAARGETAATAVASASAAAAAAGACGRTHGGYHGSGSGLLSKFKLGSRLGLLFALLVLWTPQFAWGTDSSEEWTEERSESETGPWFDFSDDYFTSLPSEALTQTDITSNEIGSSAADINLKWSLDESLTTIGYVYHQVSELHVLYSYSNVLTAADWMSLWQRSFRQEQRAATTSVMLLALSNTQVTDRPMGGILILKLGRLVGEDLLVQLRDKSEDDPSLQEQLDKFELALKQAILESVRQVLIRMALLVESNWLCSEQMLQAQFPDVLVTAYRARGSGGPSAVVERGEFGSELSEGVVTVLNQKLNANEMYVQLSVADPINAQKTDATFISALKAASMFKQRLEDDPSLPGVGLAEVVYSTFNDLQYAEIAVGGNSKYDPDLHLLLQVPSEHFKDAAAFHELFMGAILVQPLTYATPRHVRMDRVRVMGYAMKAGAGRPIRMGKFGSGLSYSEQALIDQLIQRHGFVVHVLVVGLRNDIGRKEAEATAEEIYKRFKSRTRGTFNVIFMEPVKPPEVSVSGDVPNRHQGYPGWVIGVAVGAVTVFFLGLLSCLILRKHVHMPWWIDCFCSPSPPSFQGKAEETTRAAGDFSRSSSFRPSVETGESPYFDSDEIKPSKRLGAPVRGAPTDVNVAWETGSLSTLEMAKSKRLESKRQVKKQSHHLNSIPEFIAEAKVSSGLPAAATKPSNSR
ncbi:hypothetical protein Emag_004602 [Eimeria magna]